jgi:hypothetical protein
MSLGDYYKHFVGIYGGLTTAIGSIPLLSLIIPKDYARCLFPPIGPPQDFLRIALPIVAVMVTFVVYQARDRDFVYRQTRFKTLSVLAVVGLLSFIVYVGLSIRYVHTISNGPNPSVTVSIGYDRSDYVTNNKDAETRAKFATQTDVEIVQGQGAEAPDIEESLYRLFTPSSIFRVRFALFLSYLFCFVPFVGVGSFLVLFDILDNSAPLLRTGDLVGLDGLIYKLKSGGDSLSKHLFDSISPDTRLLINQHVAGNKPDSKLLDGLTTDLNGILKVELLSDRFRDVNTSEKMSHLRKHFIVRLNRRFLEDAYPDQIAPRADS